MHSKIATVLFSGGIDSLSCMHLLRTEGYSVRGLFVDFGQPAANQERIAVDKLCQALNFSVAFVQASASVNFTAGELVGRNAFLIFTAMLLGKCHDGLLAIGVHAGTSYYDCSPEFISKVDVMVRESTAGKLSVAAPFLNWAKDEVYSYFLRERLPLVETYSCENGTWPPCGACASCHDRVRIEC